MYTLFFLYYLPSWSIPEDWLCFPVLYNRTRLFIHSFFFFFSFLGLHLQHKEVPRLGVKLELQLPACATAIATQDPNHICDLCCYLWQCQVLNPVREAMDWTHILMDTSQVLKLLSHNVNSLFIHSKCNSLHLLTPNPQSIPLPLANHKSYVYESISVL